MGGHTHGRIAAQLHATMTVLLNDSQNMILDTESLFV